MEKSQNGSDKGSKNLTDNRKRFNVLYSMGEEGGRDVWTFGLESPLLLGKCKSVKHPVKSLLAKISTN